MKAEVHLEGAFGRAEPDHFVWQTSHPYVGERERELVRGAFLPLKGRLLDIGCGEGATLRHLGEPEGATGIDLFEDKIAFAQRELPRCRFLAGSAYEMPFGDAAFDQIVVRDLVHHLDDPERFVDECARVLAPGGRIDILEPSRGNPMIVAHALLTPVERGELRSSLPFLSGLLSRRFEVVSTNRYQPMPIHRIVFHPRLGASLGSAALAARAVGAVEAAAARVLPRAMWAYIHVRALQQG